MIKKIQTLMVIICLENASVFAEEIPSFIKTFYSDWNFIAISITKDKQDIYWKMISENKITDIHLFTQNEALIIGSFKNIYKNHPKKMNTSPIGNKIINLTDCVKNGNDKYIIKFELRNIIKRPNIEINSFDKSKVYEEVLQLPITAKSECIWQYLINEYILINEGHVYLIN